MSCVRVALLLLASGAGSALTLPALPSTLPLLHFNLDKFLLPGESRRLRIVKAEALIESDSEISSADFSRAHAKTSGASAQPRPRINSAPVISLCASVAHSVSHRPDWLITR